MENILVIHDEETREIPVDRYDYRVPRELRRAPIRSKPTFTVTPEVWFYLVTSSLIVTSIALIFSKMQ